MGEKIKVDGRTYRIIERGEDDCSYCTNPNCISGPYDCGIYEWRVETLFSKVLNKAKVKIMAPLQNIRGRLTKRRIYNEIMIQARKEVAGWNDLPKELRVKLCECAAVCEAMIIRESEREKIRC